MKLKYGHFTLKSCYFILKSGYFNWQSGNFELKSGNFLSGYFCINHYTTCSLTIFTWNLAILARYSASKMLFFILFFRFAVSLSYYGISFSIPDLSGDRYLNFMIGGGIELAAYILAFVVLNGFGRKFPLLVYLILSGLLCVSVVCVKHYVPSKHNFKQNKSNLKKNKSNFKWNNSSSGQNGQISSNNCQISSKSNRVSTKAKFLAKIVKFQVKMVKFPAK